MSESSAATTSKAKVKSLTPPDPPKEEARLKRNENPIKPQQPKAVEIGKGPQKSNLTKQPKAAKVGVPKSQKDSNVRSRTRKQPGNDSDDDRLLEKFNVQAEAKQQKVKSCKSKKSAGPQQQQHNARNQPEETYEDGGRYSGPLCDGKRHGQGTFTFSNGESYEGEWKEDKMHGQGTFAYPNGESYEGEWKEDKMHGQGTYTFSNRSVYKGQWEYGKRHGQGTHTFSNGEYYVGEYKDKRHGQGTYTYASGKVYQGEFKDDKQHGHGTRTYADGESYEGQWEDGKKHGQGKVFDPQGMIIQEGEWLHGVFIGALVTGVSQENMCPICVGVSDEPTEFRSKEGSKVSRKHARPCPDHATDSDSSALTTAASTASPTPTKSSPEPEPLDEPVVQVMETPPQETIRTFHCEGSGDGSSAPPPAAVPVATKGEDPKKAPFGSGNSVFGVVPLLAMPPTAGGGGAASERGDSGEATCSKGNCADGNFISPQVASTVTVKQEAAHAKLRVAEEKLRECHAKGQEVNAKDKLIAALRRETSNALLKMGNLQELAEGAKAKLQVAEDKHRACQTKLNAKEQEVNKANKKMKGIEKQNARMVANLEEQNTALETQLAGVSEECEKLREWKALRGPMTAELKSAIAKITELRKEAAKKDEEHAQEIQEVWKSVAQEMEEAPQAGAALHAEKFAQNPTFPPTPTAGGGQPQVQQKQHVDPAAVEVKKEQPKPAAPAAQNDDDDEEEICFTPGGF